MTSTATIIPADTDAGTKPIQRKSKKKLIAIALVMALAGAAYWFMLKPAPTGKQQPEPGPVTVLEPIQLNLAAGRYLMIGLALQASADADEELDGSKALDSAIKLFSGRPIEELSLPEERARLKKEFIRELTERYDGDVIDVYFTQFVTQ